MKLTKEQFDALTPYRKHFETMVNAKWSRHPGVAAMELIHSIYAQVTGVKIRLNLGCRHCIETLLYDMGKIYLEDAEEREKKKVEVAETETTDPVKAEVKTKRKYTRKKKTE